MNGVDLMGVGDVSRETFARLEAFSALVLKWTEKINLIAKGTKDDIWHRHILDSAQVWTGAPKAWTHWVDIGSGGGFPGIVVACIAVEKRPGTRFTLIESDQRKATFLRTAARELGLPVTVIANRIEAVEPQRADVLSARALASLDLLLNFAEIHLSPTGTALFQKGRGADQEISEAKSKWTFDFTCLPSITDPEANLICIRDIARV